MLNISAITVEKLEVGHFREELPELFELKDCIENNGSHNQDVVFDHTLAVLREFDKLLKLVNENTRSFLSQLIETNSRAELLYLAILFHDIAKNDTIIKNGEITSCPQHEEVGAKKVQKILNRFKLSGEERIFVTNLIRYHGEIHLVLSYRDHDLDRQLANFKKRHIEIFRELVLLGMADTLGSHLKDNNPEEYRFRHDFYTRLLKSM